MLWSWVVVWLVMVTITRDKVKHVIGYAGRVQYVINCESQRDMIIYITSERFEKS